MSKPDDWMTLVRDAIVARVADDIVSYARQLDPAAVMMPTKSEYVKFIDHAARELTIELRENVEPGL